MVAPGVPRQTGAMAIRTLSTLAFGFLTSVIVVMAAERAYWPWGGISVENLFGIAVYYLLPVAATLWLLAATRASRVEHVVLGGAVLAFLVEGVLTPVIYEDGALPLLAMLFVGWHGLVAFVGFWYLARRWLVERRLGRLAAASIAFGLYWGLWATTWRLPESREGLEAAEAAPDPTAFALYALVVGVVLAGAHWLSGFVWPTELRASRGVGTALGLGLLGYHVVAAVVVVPWATVKLVALLAPVVWLLWRSRGDEPTVFAQLGGRVRLGDTVVLLAMPAAAAAVFALTEGWEVAAIREYFDLLNLAQALAGTVALAWAAVRTWRARPRRTEALAIPE